MFCGDDEFMVPSGLVSCLEFLEQNSSYSVCIGRCVGFLPKKNRIKLFTVKEDHRTHLVNQDNAESRINYHMQNYQVTTIYGVHRTESFKFCFETTNREFFSCAYIQETLIELFAASFGKSKVLSVITWLRSFENPPIQSDTWNRKYYISDWYDDSAMKEEKDLFHLLINKKLSMICQGAELETARKAASISIAIRIDKDRNERLNSLKNQIWFYSKIKDLTKRVVLGVLSKMHIIEKHSYFVNSNNYSYKYLKRKSGIDLKEDELNVIMKNILTFHEQQP